ncbi:MAG: hypothetical protein ABW007_19250 [Chitinophagaceae bacterium]
MPVPVIDTVTRKNPNDRYPVTKANEALGGHYNVDTIAQRNNIPMECRLEGMEVSVKETGLTYKLQDGITNAHFVDRLGVIKTVTTSLDSRATTLEEQAFQQLPQQTILGNPGTSSTIAQAMPLSHGVKVRNGKLGVGGDESWTNVKIYIACRTDNQPGTGTINDPFDGSTAAKIDAILKPYSDNFTKINVYWYPGVYVFNPVKVLDVYPFSSTEPTWVWRDGWHWEGAGKGRTIWKSDPAAHKADDPTGAFIMWRWGFKPNQQLKCASIKNGTIDCSVTGADNTSLPGPAKTYTLAFDFDVEDFTCKEVEFINAGGRGQEIFPVIITNGLLSTTNACRVLISRCNSKDLHQAGNGTGILLHSAQPGLTHEFTVVNCAFTDQYITWVNVNHVSILYNYFFNGRSGYSNINVDTGKNYRARIEGNIFMDAGSTAHHLGCITVGNYVAGPETFEFEAADFIIRNNFCQPRHDAVAPVALLRCAGACKRFIVEGNFFKKMTPFAPYGYFDDSTILTQTPFYPGYGINLGWHVPTIPNEPIQAWNNVCIDDGSVPLGLENRINGDAVIGGVSIAGLSTSKAGRDLENVFSGTVLNRHIGSKAVDIANLSDAVMALMGGGLDPAKAKGNWNASLNVPALPAASGHSGEYYWVSTAGNGAGGNGAANGPWTVGETIYSDGTAWVKKPQAPLNIAPGSLDFYDIGNFEIRDDAKLADGTDIAVCFATEDGTESIITWTPLGVPIPNPTQALATEIQAINNQLGSFQPLLVYLNNGGIGLNKIAGFEVREEGAWYLEGETKVHLPYVLATEDGTEIVSANKTDGTPVPTPGGAAIVALQERVTDIEALTDNLSEGSLPLQWLEHYEVREAGAWLGDDPENRTHLPWVFATEDGTEIVNAGDVDGVIWPKQSADVEIPEPIPPANYILYGKDSGGVGISDDSGESTLIDTSGIFRDFQPSGEEDVFIARSNRYAGTFSKHKIKKTVPSALSTSPKILLGFGMTGQSLSVGASSNPTLTTTVVHPGYNLMFNGGTNAGMVSSDKLDFYPEDATSFVDMYEKVYFPTGPYRETPIIGALNRINTINQQNMGMRVKLWGASHGRGGARYNDIKKGKPSYTNFLYEITRAKALADANGWTFIYVGTFMIHGETDRRDGTSAATYASYLNELLNDETADVKAITGQTFDHFLITDQMHSWTAEAYGFATPTTTIGQLNAALSNPRIILAGPKYWLNYSGDGIHLPGLSSRKAGEQLGKAAYAKIFGNGIWHPFAPIEIGQTSDKVWAKMRTPQGHGLIFDTARVSDPGNLGFELVGGSISGTPYIEGDRVVIPKIGSATDLRYAFTGIIGNDGGPLTGARGCLRDLSPDVSVFTTEALPNHCATFDMSVPPAP